MRGRRQQRDWDLRCLHRRRLGAAGGVEAGGESITPGRHAARFAGGSAGVLQGTRTFVLQDEAGNIEPTHSVSAGLDYAAVGPEHAWLHELGRATYHHVSDDEALAAFETLARTEGIIPALESSHAIAYVMKVAKGLGRDVVLLVNLSGRGDKDVQSVEQRKKVRRMSRIDAAFRELRGAWDEPAWSPTSRRGDPDLERSREILVRLDRAGADVLEVGVPFSDPLADGPVIQRATERAIAGGATLERVLQMVADVRSRINAPIVLFTYANPILRMGLNRFVERAKAVGVDGVLTLDVPPEESEEIRSAFPTRGLIQFFC